MQKRGAIALAVLDPHPAAVSLHAVRPRRRRVEGEGDNVLRHAHRVPAAALRPRGGARASSSAAASSRGSTPIASTTSCSSSSSWRSRSRRSRSSASSARRATALQSATRRPKCEAISASEHPPPDRDVLLRHEQHHGAVAVRDAERQHFRHERADLLRREVDHRHDEAMQQLAPWSSASSPAPTTSSRRSRPRNRSGACRPVFGRPGNPRRRRSGRRGCRRARTRRRKAVQTHQASRQNMTRTRGAAPVVAVLLRPRRYGT